MSNVTNFIEYTTLYGIEIKVFKDEDNDKYINKNVLESWLCVDPKKEHDFLFDRKDHHSVHGYIDDYVKVEKAIEVIQLLRSHPTQYNCQLAIKGLFVENDYVIDEDILKKYKKKEETYTMAAIYAKYGRKFRIFPQYRLLDGTYRTDGFLGLLQESIPGMYVAKEDRDETEVYPGGILLEIDENDHVNYDPEDEVSRHNIIKTHRYSLVRTKTGDCFKRLCIKIESAKQEQQVIYTSNVDPEKIWDELQNHSIEADFFKLFRKCLNPDDKYCITSEEVSTYLEKRHDNIKRNIDKCIKGYPEEYKSCSSLVRSKIVNIKHGGNNKKLIYMTVSGMQLIMMSLRGNTKATKAQLSLITCYKIAFKVALALKQQVTHMVSKTKVQAFNAIEEMNEKESRKHKKSSAKLKFVDKKREDDIQVYIERILKIEKEANEMRLKIQNFELNEETRKTNMIKEKGKKTKYMNMYRTTKTDLTNSNREKDETLKRLEKYKEKSISNPTSDKFKKKIEKHKNRINEQDEKILSLEKDNTKYKAKVVKYVSMVNEKIKDNNRLKIIIKELKNPDSKICHISKDEVEVHSNSKYDVKYFTGKNMTELKDICRSKGIGGYSKFNKNDLITFMFNHPKMK